ncbi:unnamed protein product [Sphenostylis stenocarpa]|uniref:Cytochrome P450 n=1 Tax=Sphenostylis stenocarpa TaxID=92480 RepID=A0AA86VXV0_9FABA|nr:unnamed protein product [Sphenostylis stenocarpa]
MCTCMKRVQSLHQIREEVAKLVNELRDVSSSDECNVNLSEMLNSTSNNIVCKCALGRKYTRDGYSRVKELARNVMVQLVAFTVGDYFHLLGWVDYLTGKIQEYKATFHALDALFDQTIAEHLTEKMECDHLKNKDFVDILLQHQQSDMLNLELTKNDLKALLLDMFVGGTDTGAVVLEWAISELARNPTIMKKVQEEVRKIDIPAKTRVYVNAWAIQRDPTFWESPEEFMPERFENSEIDFKGQHSHFIPFGFGRRGYPGMNFGVTFVEYILATLLYRFDWKLPESDRLKQDIDMTEMKMALQSTPQPSSSKPTASFSFLCFFISVVFVVFKLSRRTKRNSPPSPPKIPVIGNLHQLGTLPHRSFQALSRKHGPLMLLQLGQVPTLVVSSADVAGEILKAHDLALLNRPKSAAGGVFLYGYKDVAFAPYGEEWRQKRKVCALELVSMKSVRSLHFIRVEEVAEMVGAIREACASQTASVNLSELLIALSNNIMSRCILGQKYDTPDGRSSFGEIGRTLLSQFTAFCVGDFFPCLGWVDVLTGQISKFKATFRLLDGFFDQVIAEHKEKMKKRDGILSEKKDFVDILFQLHEAGLLGFQLSQDVLKAFVMTLKEKEIEAGASDTSSTVLEWTMAELMRNPNTMEKAQEEVRRVVGDKAEVDEDDLKQMSYLNCVLKESLRLHPPAPLLIPRETTSDVKLRGYDIPAKTRVMFNAWAIQRDPELWDKPDEFLPDRFKNSHLDFKGQDFEFIPFGSGRRGCPGISFGMTVVGYALANLLYWFDWKLPKTDAAEQGIDMNETYGLTVSKMVPLLLQPTPFSLASGSKP